MLDSKRELCIAYHNKELTTDVGYKGIAVVATSHSSPLRKAVAPATLQEPPLDSLLVAHEPLRSNLAIVVHDHMLTLLSTGDNSLEPLTHSRPPGGDPCRPCQRAIVEWPNCGQSFAFNSDILSSIAFRVVGLLCALEVGRLCFLVVVVLAAPPFGQPARTGLLIRGASSDTFVVIICAKPSSLASHFLARSFIAPSVAPPPSPPLAFVSSNSQRLHRRGF